MKRQKKGVSGHEAPEGWKERKKESKKNKKMEGLANITSNIPKWFWIALGLIVLSTIIAMVYCNYKTSRVAAAVKADIDSSPLSEPMKVLIKEEVKMNVIELFPDLTSVLHN